VLKDFFQCWILAGIHALVIPVYRFQFFHQGNDCPMHVLGFIRKIFCGFMKSFIGYYVFSFKVTLLLKTFQSGNCWMFMRKRIDLNCLSGSTVSLKTCLDEVRDYRLSIRHQIIFYAGLNHSVLITDSLMLA